MSRRVAIATRIGRNYGAVLQAFALCEVVEGLGYNASVVYYAHEKSRRTYRVARYGTSAKGLYQNAVSLLHAGKIRVSIERFLRFRQERLRLTRPYHSFEALSADPPDADLYLCGSDQIWNPQIGFHEAYFLRFGPQALPRVAYAASIGMPHMPEAYQARFFEAVRSLSRVSVRERDAQALLEGQGISSEHVLDPTLLLKPARYAEIARPVAGVPEGFLLTYFLHLPRYAVDLVRGVSRALGLPVLNLTLDVKAYPLPGQRIWDAGPEEFLWLFGRAEAVVTSSYHGVIFAILHRKPFWAVLNDKTGGRTQDLLQTLGLEHRIVRSGELVGFADTSIGWEAAGQRMEGEIARSRAFLQSALCQGAGGLT